MKNFTFYILNLNWLVNYDRQTANYNTGNKKFFLFSNWNKREVGTYHTYSTGVIKIPY